MNNRDSEKIHRAIGESILDIRLLRQTEEKVRLNEERLQLALDAAHLATWDWDLSSGMIVWNSEHYRILGYEPDSFAPSYHHWADRVHQDDLQATEEAIQRAIKNGDDYRAEFRVVLPNGTMRTLESLGRVERDQAGTSVRLYGAMSDVTERIKTVDELRLAKESLEERVNERTAELSRAILRLNQEIEERKQAEAELRKAQELFSLLMKHTPVYTFIKELDGEQSRVVLISDNYIDMLGRPSEELSGKTMEELFPADLARKISNDDLLVVNEGRVIHQDEEFADRSYETIKFPITSSDDKKFIAGFSVDITEKKLKEEVLRRSQNEFRQLAESMPQIVWITRPDGWHIYFNQQWMDYTGLTLEESLGHGWNKPFHPDDQQFAWEAWQNATGKLDTYSLECRLRRADGAYKWWLIRGVPVFDEQGAVVKWFGTCTDIDDFKRAEEERLSLEKQLQHAQKLESLGILAGGIAHDFNNILTAIIGNAELARMKLPSGSPIVTYVQQIEQASLRAADLAKQMLAYSGKGKFMIVKLDLNCLVEEMVPMLEVSISKKSLLKLDLAPALPAVKADSSQIHQIIMNLVINASEAIGEEGGFITIKTGSMECTANYLKQFVLNENTDAGEYVYLEVTDTGCGMDRETLDRIFDPFFSTKFTGRGLGMAAVHGIVRGHKGGIHVYSEPGKGTIFKLLLPAIDRPAAIHGQAAGTEDGHGSGTVLLVDDEDMIRGVGAEMLKSLGFTTITANDGIDALKVFKSRGDIACVILDLTMPHMDGEQCFHELRQLCPEVKVIMSSGYSEHEVAKKFAGMGVSGFIQKPFGLSALKEVLKGALS